GVLDALIRQFGLKPPPLTQDPIGFFAQQLRQALWADEGKQETEDVYAIHALIERVEKAKGAEEQLRVKLEVPSAARGVLIIPEEQVRVKVEAQLEAVREALRQSDYTSAVRGAQRVDLTLLNCPQLREVANSMST